MRWTISKSSIQETVLDKTDESDIPADIMSFIAALLTFLFFCHPGLLAVVAIVLAIVLLCSAASPLGVALLELIVIGYLVYKLIAG